jgi:endonuclease-3
MATKQKREKAAEVLRRLRERYPDAECALKHHDAWQLLVATILSAQTTDVRVNMVTPHLFARYPTAGALAVADPLDVEEIVKSTGFYHQKTNSIVSMSQDLVARFDGEVPQRLEDLVTLRGVGRKTANVVIGVAFGGAGVVVDTHVKRIARLLGWTREADPVKIERNLMDLFPRNDWTVLGHTLIWQGRTICIARRPKCPECPVNDLCPEGRRRMSLLAKKGDAESERGEGAQG